MHRIFLGLVADSETKSSSPARSSGESSANRATSRECAGEAAEQLAVPPVIPDNCLMETGITGILKR